MPYFNINALCSIPRILEMGVKQKNIIRNFIFIKGL